MKTKDKIEFAKEVHKAQEYWAEKADLKASILFAAQVILLGTYATRFNSCLFLLDIFAINSLLFGIYNSLKCVLPRLPNPSYTNLIYFGSIARFDDKFLFEQYNAITKDSILEDLTKNIRIMSVINLRKHQDIRLSTLFTGASIGLFVASILLPFIIK